MGGTKTHLHLRRHGSCRAAGPDLLRNGARSAGVAEQEQAGGGLAAGCRGGSANCQAGCQTRAGQGRPKWKWPVGNLKRVGY